MRLHTLLPMVLACISLTSQASDIYKWKNDGKTVYGEYPPAGVQAEKINRISGVKVNKAQRASVQERLQESEQAARDKAEKDQIVADAAAYKQARKENCSTAQRNLAMLQAGGRHRFKLPDGTISYLDEAETQRRVDEAQSQINDYCD